MQVVPSTPEEIVRQHLLQKMIGPLGFPKGLLWVEKEISLLPHLREKALPSTLRRADILCFAKGIHPEHELYPLILIECKAHWIKKATDQVLGYNESVGACFVATAGCEQIQTLWYNGAKMCYESVDFLPSYQELKSSAQQWQMKNY